VSRIPPLLPGGLLVLTAVVSHAAAPPPVVAPERTPAPACGWFDPVQGDAIDHATRLMPDALRRLLTRHRRSVLEGARQARESAASDPGSHLQPPLAADGAARRLAEALASAIDQLNRHAPLRQVAASLGAAAHDVADLTNPFQCLAAHDPARADAARFAEYLGATAPRARVVFEGYTDPDLDAGDPAAFGRRLADRSRTYLDDLIGAYRRFDAEGDAALFDDRSVPFGVASLSYSRTVTDTARAWLYAWRGAHGDLAGLPYPLDSPPPAARSGP
jgi:hypothetical protein